MLFLSFFFIIHFYVIGCIFPIQLWPKNLLAGGSYKPSYASLVIYDRMPNEEFWKYAPLMIDYLDEIPKHMFAGEMDLQNKWCLAPKGRALEKFEIKELAPKFSS